MFNDKVMRATFLISIAGHCLLLGAAGFNLPLTDTVNNPPELTVNFEIEPARPCLLPKIEVVGEEKKIKAEDRAEESPLPAERITEVPVQKATFERIEITNPAQEAMLRYQDMIKRQIEQARRYPAWAEKQGIEGVAYLSFTVSRAGAGDNVRIVRSSGSKILDEAAAHTIKRANPFPPIPTGLNQDFVCIELAIAFKIRPEL